MKANFSHGEHLMTPRTGFSHHGIYVGRGWVVHYDGLNTGLKKGAVTRVKLDDFAAGRPVAVRRYRHRLYGAKESVLRALSCVGENNYHAVFNNCEHFVSWCITGRRKSRQVRIYLGLSLVVSTLAARLAHSKK